MITRKSSLMLLLLLCFVVTGCSVLQAQDMITVYPQEYPNALSNPLMGFRPDPDRAKNPKYPYPTIVRDYIRWNQIENDASDGVQKIIDYCNAKWKGLEKYNVKVIPRVYLDWDSNTGNECWPADLTNGDWSSQEFKDRVVKLVYKLGQAWDNDPRVAWVQTGIIGYWGEQENPVGVDEDGWAQRLGDAFTNAFHNKKLLVRNQNAWPGYEMGVYWDSFGHPGQKPWAWTNIKKINDQGRYLTQVVEGEVAYNWGENVFDPLYGGEPEITLNSAEYTDNMIDVIRELHCTGLGWIASYDLDGSFGTDPETIKANASRMQKEFGYRFVIPEFSCSPRADQGGSLDINFKVLNTSAAPMYEGWPLAFVLIDESTRQIVWSKVLPGNDIRMWHPGDGYDYDTRTYTTPAAEHTITASVAVPATIPIGQYMAGLTILEPYSRTPGVFFAIENFLKESQSQPLCRIGIGQDVVGSHELNSDIFDDPVSDDNRYYALEWTSPIYMLTTSATTGGSVSPGSGSYRENNYVTLKATAELGYVFSEWTGDLTGSTNPTKISMDADKNITANFTSVPTYTLTASASTGGSISIYPEGGIYNEGTLVTITATAELGYVFSGWSGDFSSSTNPAEITMDSDKNIIATFDAVPVYTLTANAIGGSISFDPPGPQYNEGTKVKVKATANSGYTFTKWSGDALDFSSKINPNRITMDADKSITAEFVGPSDQTDLWIETFTLPDGTTSNSGSTAWIATRSSGLFEVRSNRLMLNDAGPEGVFTTSEINISGRSVGVSVDVEGAGGLDPENSENKDYFGFYIKVDGGAEQLIYDNYGTQSARTLSETDISGSTLVLIIKGYTTSGDEFYYFDNLKVTADDASSIDAAKILPLSTQLMQNYPNPFNPETTIPYQLSELSHVKLIIYNFLGQQVATLVDEQQAAGYHIANWNGNDASGIPMANGIYIYRLETGNNSIHTKKFILTR